MGERPISRRDVVLAALATAAVAACGVEWTEMVGPDRSRGAGDARDGRLRARPLAPVATGPSTGLQPLELGQERDGLLWVPEDYRAEEPRPLILALHGAGASGRNGLDIVTIEGQLPPALVVAPDSRGMTWDVLLAGFGPDVEFIDRALARTFARYAVDAERLAVAGFSDGASYALGLGLANGDLFRRVAAFSPGFVPGARAHGPPPSLLITHGRHDDVLPIDATSRRLVPRLRRAGYAIDYREFDGGHELPAELARQALAWMTT